MPEISEIFSNRQLQDDPLAILKAIRAVMAPNLALGFADDLRFHSQVIAFTAFVVRRTPDGAITILELEFSVSGQPEARVIDEPVIKTVIPEGIKPAGRFVYYQGVKTPELEQAVQQINADRPDDEMLTAIDHSFRVATESYGDSVGGSIDVAEITLDGVKWLRRKAAPERRESPMAAPSPYKKFLNKITFGALNL